ncbi:hypothetical protein [Paenibacillus pseudetheri]|uniref:hypothetical protein n=1 Tax=Paenibacillus pseudetheri TaxID=2897682 RepID=UPI001F3ED7D4|nr:hypothetical protein [Paenibacillus pseudetheri]
MKLSLILNGIYKELKRNCFNAGEIITLGAQIRAGEMFEWLEKSGIPWLRETQGMIQEHVEILRLQLTGMSYEEAVTQLQADVQQGTLF